MNQHTPNFFKLAKYQRKIDENLTQCLTCEHKCKLRNNKIGICKTRINLNGVIVSFVYGLLPAISYNPIEKKPLFHFHPGSYAITIGTYGCNFNCFWCQNQHLSHPNENVFELMQLSRNYVAPEEIINLALTNHCQGTSISFNEPTLLFEYSLEIFKLAKKKGLYNTYVTNGYMTEEVLRDLVEYGLDAMNIDIKGNNAMVRRYCGADNELVWKTAKLADDLGVHIEVTTLLIEDYNTDQATISQISEAIVSNFGKSTPFHITRAFPYYQSNNHGLFEPTPISSLINAYNIAKRAGLDYVYLGNLPHSDYENTYCPGCNSLVIKRFGYNIKKLGLNLEGKCSNCGHQIIKYI